MLFETRSTLVYSPASGVILDTITASAAAPPAKGGWSTSGLFLPGWTRPRPPHWPSRVHRYSGHAVSTARCIALAFVQWPKRPRER